MISLRLVRDYFKRIEKQNDELIWAKTWEDTCRGIDWLENMPSVSPGRWAVGYNYLYVMTRILNDIEPHRVLDLGLGISSTLISRYFSYRDYADGLHTIVEHDEEWVKFYTYKNKLSPVSDINIQKLVEKQYKGHPIFAYENLAKVVSEKKYTVISIDAPFGSEEYSRRDIIEFLPTILDESFVLIIDDSNRKGEWNTITEIEEILKINGIGYHKSIYPGMTDCCVIASLDNKFLCSL